MADTSLNEEPNSVALPPPSGVGGGGVVVSRRLIVFDPASGMPVPAEVPCLTRPQLENLAGAALSLPYTPEEPEEPDYTLATTEANKELMRSRYEKEYERWQAEGAKYAGLSCAEVMMLKRAQSAAAGDADAMDAMLDRAIGKPKQSSESLVKTMKYEDYLKQMADQEGAARRVEVHITDVDPDPFTPPPPDEFPGLGNIL